MNLNRDKCKVQENLWNKSKRKEKFLSYGTSGKNVGQKFSALVTPSDPMVGVWEALKKMPIPGHHSSQLRQNLWG